MSTTEQLIEERGKRHGDFELTSKIYGELFEICLPMLSKPENAPLRYSMCNVLNKLARVIAGEATYDDHWRDVKGYGAIAEAICQRIERDEAGAQEVIEQQIH